MIKYQRKPNSKQKSTYISLISIIFITTVFNLVYSVQQLLDQVPFSFKLTGSVTYTPSSGGVPVPGYKLQITYTKNQWIGIKFMQLTSYGNNDVLIFQRTTSPQSGTYKCTVSQYYTTTVRPDTLLSDTVNRMDRFVDSYSDNNQFILEIYRTLGATNGQDWEAVGAQFLRVCFFTSNTTFNAQTWTPQFTSCYGYDINNFVSTFKGRTIANFTLQGVQSFIYGGFKGPSLSMMTYLYRPSGSSLSSSSLIIKLGDNVSSTVGFDLYKCGDADYHGDYGSMTKDLQVSGYNDGSCSITQTSQATRVYFDRTVNTADEFDFTIKKNQFQICYYLTSETCVTVNLDYLFPKMNVASGVRLYEQKIVFLMGLVFFLMIFIN